MTNAHTKSAVIRGVNSVSHWLDKICAVVIVAMLGAMTVLTIAQIVCRVFFTALSWSEEATRYLLIYSTFLGASCVYKHSGHIAITLVQEHTPRFVSFTLKLIVQLACLIMFILALYFGFRYTGKVGGQLSAAMRIPMSYVYICIPISFTIMAIHAVNNILNLFFPDPAPEAAPPAEQEVEAV